MTPTTLDISFGHSIPEEHFPVTTLPANSGIVWYYLTSILPSNSRISAMDDETVFNLDQWGKPIWQALRKLPPSPYPSLAPRMTREFPTAEIREAGAIFEDYMETFRTSYAQAVPWTIGESFDVEVDLPAWKGSKPVRMQAVVRNITKGTFRPVSEDEIIVF